MYAVSVMDMLRAEFSSVKSKSFGGRCGEGGGGGGGEQCYEEKKGGCGEMCNL